jgi:prophage regulatory protein
MIFMAHIEPSVPIDTRIAKSRQLFSEVPMPAANDNCMPNLMSLKETVRVTSMSRTMLNRLRATGHFPAAVQIGERRIAFVRQEVVAWVEQRIASRGLREAA